MREEAIHPIVRSLHRLAVQDEMRKITDGQLLKRFAAERDEAAFEILIHRHGAMVWRVCRSVLRESHAAEDAFQSTFLILVRKAGSIGRPEKLSNWLYSVAYRVALRARQTQSRRAARELPGGDDLPEASTAESIERDARFLLQEELQRLPVKYRSPIVLCYLEARTNEEAARQLQWPVGTLKVRLMRGREMLRSRLARRGLALSVAGATTVLSEITASAVTPMLVDTTIRAAIVFAAGKAAGFGGLSAPAVTLTHGVLRTMRWNQLKTVAAVFLAVGLLGTGVFTYRSNAADQKDVKTSAPLEGNETKTDPKVEEAPRSDKLAIKGVWTLVSRESADKKETLTEESIKKGNGKLTIIGDKFTFVESGTTHEGAWKINPDKSPKQIDFVTGEADEVPQVLMRGIYTLEKDKLTICYNNPRMEFGLPRPTEIAVKENAIFPTIAVFKRAIESDEQKLQGTWIIDSALLDEKKVDELIETQVVFDGDQLSATFEKGKGTFGFKVDPSTKPTKIDVIGNDEGLYEGATLLGVYELDGDTLKMCFITSGKRPTELAAKVGVRQFEVVLKRVRK